MLNWLEHTSKYTVDPGAVDLDDRTYYVPCFAGLEALVKSIEKVGILERARSPGALNGVTRSRYSAGVDSRPRPSSVFPELKRGSLPRKCLRIKASP